MALIKHFPSWMAGGGIFATLDGVPWDDAPEVDKIALDIDYFGNRSGLKTPSPLILRMTSGTDDHVLSDAEIAILQRVLKNRYLESWRRVWNVLLVDYDPITNYSMTEVETPDLTTQTKQKTDITRDVGTATDLTREVGAATDVTRETKQATDQTRETSTATDLSKTTETDSKTETNSSATSKIFAFNASTTPVSATTTDGDSTVQGGKANNKQTEHTTGTASANKQTEHTTGSANNNVSTERTTGDATKNKTTEHTTGSAANNKTIEHTSGAEDNNVTTQHQSGTRQLTRKGNIGVTTSQQMITSEIELRKQRFFEIVFTNLDDALTSPIWE